MRVFQRENILFGKKINIGGVRYVPLNKRMWNIQRKNIRWCELYFFDYYNIVAFHKR